MFSYISFMVSDLWSPKSIFFSGIIKEEEKKNDVVQGFLSGACLTSFILDVSIFSDSTNCRIAWYKLVI